MSESKKRKPNKGNRSAEKYAKKLKAANDDQDWVRKAPRRDAEFEFDSDPVEESPTPEGSGGDDGVSWPSEDDGGVVLPDRSQPEQADSRPKDQKSQSKNASLNPAKTQNEDASLNSRAKQKAVTQERKAGKANAEYVARAKKIWERLRRGDLPNAERKQLVEELLGIVTGRAKEFVLKHDAGRVVQSAIKHGSTAQRRMIAEELKGEYRNLAASKYAKFTIGKLLGNGDDAIRDTIVPEFYGHVRGLIKHPEGGWILDDIYRGAATKEQKSTLLREWYGAEYALLGSKNESAHGSELKILLHKHPEKRAPVLNYLYEMINSLVQKRTTGFTMLHDAMLQYFLNVEPDSEQAKNFMEMVLGDEEGDLLKNMAFTASGARTVSLLIAHGSAKDRKLILRVYKGHIDALAFDRNGHQVLITALECIDDTVLTSKAIYGELLPTGGEAVDEQIVEKLNHLTARIPILLPFVYKVATISTPGDKTLLSDIYDIRTKTSKKDSTSRSKELIRSIAPRLLSLIARQPVQLMQTAFGCVFIQEVLLSSPGDLAEREGARDSIVELVTSEKIHGLADGEQAIVQDTLDGPAATRLLKTLVYSGHFNSKSGKVELCDAPLGFADSLSRSLLRDKKAGESVLLAWAIGVRTFVVEAMLRSDDMASAERQKIRLALKKHTVELRASAIAVDNRSQEDKTARSRVSKKRQQQRGGSAEHPESDSQSASARIGGKGAAIILDLLK